jgi:hypothetical protein
MKIMPSIVRRYCFMSFVDMFSSFVLRVFLIYLYRLLVFG